MSWLTLSEVESSITGTPSAEDIVSELVLRGHKVKTSLSNRVDTLYCQNGLNLKQKVSVLREEYRALSEDISDYLVSNLPYDNTMDWNYYGFYDGSKSGSGTTAKYTASISPVSCTCGSPSSSTSRPGIWFTQTHTDADFVDGDGYGPTEGTRVDVENTRSNEADGFRVTVTTTTYGVPYNEGKNTWLPWYPTNSKFSSTAFDVSREETVDLVCYDNGKKILQHVKTVVTEQRDVPYSKVDSLVSGNTSLNSVLAQYAVPIGSGTNVGYQYFNVRSGGSFSSSSATTTSHATDKRAVARLTDQEKNLFTVTVTSSEYWITRE